MKLCGITVGDNIKLNVRLVDCVGYLVNNAIGHLEDDMPRMVKTPWFPKPIPFHEAAEEGTRKVIQQHSTIGLVVTADGSFGEIPRENLREAEEAAVKELKNQGKPFLVILNSQMPYKEETVRLAKDLKEKYQTAVVPANCEQLRKEDITRILEKILYEFPVSEVSFFIPKWVEMLPLDHPVKSQILAQIRELMKKMTHIRDLCGGIHLDGPYVRDTFLEECSLSSCPGRRLAASSV